MSYSASGREAVISYVGWFIARVVSPAIPDHLGVFILILSVLASLADIGNSSGSAIFGPFVTLLLALAFQDQITAVLAFSAIIAGLFTLLERALR